ncbi:hypothetical protein PACTADRAFT_76704 [Pachysolen tannophilus NRRL Y-2460]|uniref:Multifunctional tryptophan biosynthesis protein n=1 Tax=Pachysolen tannophilus NRRL Y-2460 TaxID=669874 RepID=A0A1E4TQP1_PACTA|nr:hypothetical protein PACTADRAFT_76704 [Pachysolen tannophilus NRRL Y-2460]
MSLLLPINRKVILIDNYDSFTWNLYQYLCQEGAEVLVYRNDKISVEEISELNPDLIVISPGPGHPSKDSGVSCQVIENFKGKIPIFGICMGEQCIYASFGGDVDYAGEIVHGKTTAIHHDGKGVFKNVPQGIAITRYHSLAGTKATLPEDLLVTSRTDNGIIMGVRHKKYTIEGVQFHPESILTEQGHLMIRNMLTIEGGYWNEENLTKILPQKKESILDKIYNQRKKDVELQSKVPGFTLQDLQTYNDLNVSPTLISFYDRLYNTIKKGKSAILSEIKRASPSKGDIDINANAAKLAFTYATNEVSAISVLTEPTWFKGSLEDLKAARKVISNLTDRPAILRKEFIFSEYQILESRVAGADTVLLIVKMLSQELLLKLYQYSKSLGMEPLVEVNSADELQRALDIGSKVIGVNNRNLHDFNVDLKTTSNLSSLIPEQKDGKPIILCALSGITKVEDVSNYKKEGIQGFLIGEALMRKGDDIKRNEIFEIYN